MATQLEHKSLAKDAEILLFEGLKDVFEAYIEDAIRLRIMTRAQAKASIQRVLKQL